MTSYGTSMTAGYTGDGLRAWKHTSSGTTYYLYSGMTPVCEMNASGTVTAVNTFGVDGLASRHSGSSSTFYTFDNQGGAAVRTDSNANLLGAGQFDAYGTRVASTDNSTDPFSGYGAKWGYYSDSETGLQLLGLRYYDSGTGRFINRDPISYSGGMDLYGYTGNNPVLYADPTGRWVWALAGAGAGGGPAGTLVGAGVAVEGAGVGADSTVVEAPIGAGLAVVGAVLVGIGLGVGAVIYFANKQHGGHSPPNLSPPGSGRRGALGQAKRNLGIPRCQQPSTVRPNRDKRGNRQPGREYEYDTPSGPVKIRDDAGGHEYPDDPSQSRGASL